MNRNTKRLGYFSASGIIILTTLYLILLFLPLLIKQEPEWRPAITSYYRIETSGCFLSDFIGLIFYLRTLLMIVLFAGFLDYAGNSMKVFMVIAFSFIILSAALHTLSYIGQFAVRNFNINACDNECLLYNTHSLLDNYITLVNVMALTVFVGLAELFLIPVFSKTNKIEKTIRLTLIIAGTFNLLSALMFILKQDGISAFFMFFSLIFFTVFLILYIKFFGQFKSQGYDG
jgi:hypothetical protein